MSIYVGGEKAKLYRGDYGPAQFYKGDVKIAGYTDGEKVGTQISGVDTYNDVLLPTIEGKSEQTVTVQGKNLFDPKCFVSEINASLPSAAMVKDWQGVPCVSYPCAVSNLRFMQHQFKANTQYTISGEVGFDRTQEAQIEFMALCYTDGTYRPVWIINVVSGVFSEFRFTTAANKTVDYIVVNSYSPGLISNIKIASLQLEEGTTATPYEPFVPNSPSPNYPSPIHSSEDFDVVSCGRNLFDYTQSKLYQYSVLGEYKGRQATISTTDKYNAFALWRLPKLEVGKTYTFSIDVCASVPLDWVHTTVYAGVGNTSNHTSVGITTQWQTISVVIATTKPLDLLHIYPNFTPGAIFYTSNFQIEEGGVATPYQPYHATTAHITDPLRSVGDVADSIEVSGGKVEVVRRCELKAFDGSEAWVMDIVHVNTARFRLPLKNAPLQSPVMFLCDTNQVITSGISTDIQACQIVDGNFYYRINKKYLSTIDVAGFVKYLQTHQTTILYPLATPTRTDITTTTLGQALLAMRTVPHYTQVYTNATLPPTLRAKIKEMVL